MSYRDDPVEEDEGVEEGDLDLYMDFSVHVRGGLLAEFREAVVT